MKSLTAVLLALSLSACAGLGDPSRGSTAAAAQSSVSSEKDYGMRDATRDYPYNPAQY